MAGHVQARDAPNPPALPTPLWIKIGFWISVAIAVAVVIRRVVALAHPSRSAPPQLAALDAVFASHAALTLAHILPALVFVLLSAFILFRKTPAPFWLERIWVGFGAVVGITAYAMSFRSSVGGWTERSAVLLFDTLFLFSLFRANRYMRGEAFLKRRWTVRAVAILLGIATTRPVMATFFATSSFTHLTPSQFFGPAFWIGFSINTLAVELWFRSRDRRVAAHSAYPALKSA